MNMHHAIPTVYRGIRMRSRLEAKWAHMFDQFGWTWHYEPLDLAGWIPDFLVEGTPKPVLVEVKPIILEQQRNKAQETTRKIEHALGISQRRDNVVAFDELIQHKRDLQRDYEALILAGGACLSRHQ